MNDENIIVNYYGYNYGIRDPINKWLSDESILYLSYTCKTLRIQLADVIKEREIKWGFKCNKCQLPILNFYEGNVAKFCLYKENIETTSELLNDISLDVANCFYYNINMGIAKFDIKCSKHNNFKNKIDTEHDRQNEYMRYLIEHVMFTPPKQNVRQKFLRWSFTSNMKHNNIKDHNKLIDFNNLDNNWEMFKAWVYYMLEPEFKRKSIPLRMWTDEDFPINMLDGLVKDCDFMYDDYMDYSNLF